MEAAEIVHAALAEFFDRARGNQVRREEAKNISVGGGFVVNLIDKTNSICKRSMGGSGGPNGQSTMSP